MIKEVPSSLAMMTNPRNLMVQYGLLAFVYPDQIELKGSLPIRAPGMSDVSPEKRRAPRDSGGLLKYQEVLSIKLESGYSSGSDYQDNQGNNQHGTDADYDINPGWGYRCFGW